MRRPSGCENFVTEVADDLVEDRLARLHQLAAQSVGLDDLRAELAQHGGDGAFAAAEAAGEAYAKHGAIDRR